MKNSILLLMLATLLAVFTQSCTENSVETPVLPMSKYISYYSSSDENVKIELLALDSLVNEYQNIAFKVTDMKTGALIKNAKLSAKTLMDMGMHKHSSPMETIALANENGEYESAVIFTMSDMSGGSWKIILSYELANGTKDTLDLDIKVKNSKETLIKNFTYKNEVYVITMKSLKSAKVGINDIEFFAYKASADKMTFTPVEVLIFEMTPGMPSMGHGSPNNVSPVHTQSGLYKGKINFTMTGDWKANLKISNAEEKMAEIFFLMDIL